MTRKKLAIIDSSALSVPSKPAVGKAKATAPRKRTVRKVAAEMLTVEEKLAPAKAVPIKKKAAAETKPATRSTRAKTVNHRHKNQDASPTQISETASNVRMAKLRLEGVAFVESFAPAYQTAPYQPADSKHARLEDEIAKLAYSYHEARGGKPGDPVDDWHRAADELRPKGDRIF